jgi:hypothetical protein
LAYNSDDGFIYTIESGVFRRYTTAGSLDSTSLSQPPTPIPEDLVYIGGDQLIGIVDSFLYQYDAVAKSWSTLTNMLSSSFSDADLAFDFGVLFAVNSGSDQLFKIDLTTYNVVSLGSHGGSTGGGLSTTCKSKQKCFCIPAIIQCCLGSPYNFAPAIVDKVLPANIKRVSSANFKVVVTYDDDHRLDTNTFDNEDIVLTGVSACFNNPLINRSHTAPWRTLSPTSTKFSASNGNRFVVTYTFAPPNGQWSVADAAEWSVELVAGQVGEYMTTPQYVPARTLGTFSIKSKNTYCDAFAF